jgi:hypothetical protein
MTDWLTWPADLLLSAGGFFARWLVSEDEPSFVLLQMAFAILIVAAFVFLVAWWRTLIVYRQLREKPQEKQDAFAGRS